MTDMQTYPLGTSDLKASRTGYGCMQIGGSWDETPFTDAQTLLITGDEQQVYFSSNANHLGCWLFVYNMFIETFPPSNSSSI